MSDKSLTPWMGAIADAQARFVAMADPATWAKESMFAKQIIMKNTYLMGIANKNPASLRNAVQNVATIGISLNPAEKLAYLVPRDGAACLDISYMGLIKLATDSGAIKWAQAENVYSNDVFDFNGPAAAPEHRYDPFTKDRGEYQGSYCIARTADGATLVLAMPASEVLKIRDDSEMYKKTKKGPWKDYFGEMAKKTVIKRASKTWPRSTGKLEKAIELLNEGGEGIKFVEDATVLHETYTIEQKEKFGSLVNNNDSLGLYLLEQSVPRSCWIDLANTGGKGEKVRLKERVNKMTTQGLEIVDAVKDAVDTGDDACLYELLEDSDRSLLEHLPALLGVEQGREYVVMFERVEK